MNVKDHGRTVTLLVWTLVVIGLFSGAASNALVGWTLLTLNRERVQLLEQDQKIEQNAARLQRLGQEVRARVAGMLQGSAIPAGADPLDKLPGAIRELRASLSSGTADSTLADLHRVTIELTLLWNRTVDWRNRFETVNEDLREKRTLNRARDILERLRASAETLEGRQRLREVNRLRQWRRAEGAEAAALAHAILTDQGRNWSRVLKEIRTELADLSRLVETLAGEDQVDHLADLRDNQLKPVLERLERQLAILSDELPPPGDLSPTVTAELRDFLFGSGHTIVQEYQTIRLGQGGLFRLAGESLALEKEKEELLNDNRQLFERIEAIHPVVAGLAGEHSRALTHHAEESLSSGLRHLSIASILLLGGFVALGGVISKKVRQQITALARLRRQNEMILNSAGEGILGLDRRGRTIFMNPAGERLLGWNSGRAIGCDHRRILRFAPTESEESEESVPSGGCPIGAILESGTAFHGDNDHLCRRDGSRFPVEYTATPIRNDEGDIEGAVVTFLDISDRKETEAALQRSYREMDALNRTLEEKVAERTRLVEDKNRQLIKTQEELVRKEQLAAVGSLAAGVAHEINNPTAIIRGNGEILLRKLSSEAPGREEAGEILKNTERISRITQNLLIFAREQVINPEEVQVNHLLLDILAQVPHQVACGAVKFVRELDRDLPPLSGDKVKLRQVLNNIVLNALQAMEGKGTLTVTTRRHEKTIEMRVRDSGPGISTELKGRIFNPFFTTKRTGTGLGLSVSYGIVRAMGGSIDVESAPGEGATFIVRLPCGGGASG
jgi:PAS domain S-box-containing protein